jgi:hypothetical protein
MLYRLTFIVCTVLALALNRPAVYMGVSKRPASGGGVAATIPADCSARRINAHQEHSCPLVIRPGDERRRDPKQRVGCS